MKTVWVGTMAITFVLGVGAIAVVFILGKIILAHSKVFIGQRRKGSL